VISIFFGVGVCPLSIKNQIIIKEIKNKICSYLKVNGSTFLME